MLLLYIIQREPPVQLGQIWWGDSVELTIEAVVLYRKHGNCSVENLAAWKMLSILSWPSIRQTTTQFTDHISDSKPRGFSKLQQRSTRGWRVTIKRTVSVFCHFLGNQLKLLALRGTGNYVPQFEKNNLGVLVQCDCSLWSHVTYQK